MPENTYFLEFSLSIPPPIHMCYNPSVFNYSQCILYRYIKSDIFGRKQYIVSICGGFIKYTCGDNVPTLAIFYGFSVGARSEFGNIFLNNQYENGHKN